MNYMQSSEKWQSRDPQAQKEQKELKEAHQKAFSAVYQQVECDILYDHKTSPPQSNLRRARRKGPIDSS